MKRFLIGALLGFAVLAAGCSTPSSKPTAFTPPPSNPSTATAESSVTASIPSLSFVAASTVPNGASLQPGAKLPADSLKPFLTGRHVNSVRWAIGSVNDVKQLEFDLGLDAAGRAAMTTWTKRNIGQNMLVVLGETVIANPTVAEPISGEFTLFSPYVLKARPLIDAATVPTP